KKRGDIYGLWMEASFLRVHFTAIFLLKLFPRLLYQIRWDLITFTKKKKKTKKKKVVSGWEASCLSPLIWQKTGTVLLHSTVIYK
ncbi:hypothetical protein ACMBCM_05920, partial [Spiroplasma sp. K1]